MFNLNTLLIMIIGCIVWSMIWAIILLIISYKKLLKEYKKHQYWEKELNREYILLTRKYEKLLKKKNIINK